jgi:poly-gamma-glutamate synthesis protein (capsule biosynthesis protein)
MMARNSTTRDASSPGVGTAGRSATLALAGDVMLGRIVNETLLERGWGHAWGDLAPVQWSADAFLINLECAITSHEEQWHDGAYKPFHFRADPLAVQTLRLGRVDFAALANNHIGDFGSVGMLETIALLDRHGIAHAGAGRDLATAAVPAMLTVRGLRVAVLACADYPEAWAADDSTPGMYFVRVASDDASFAALASRIAAARATADLVVFCMHWGPNLRERAPEEFRRFAHRVIDAGATIFWGHSAHVVQGIEMRPPAVILYDTGDYVDDYAVHPHVRNDLGALFLLSVSAHAVQRVRLLPVRIDHRQVNRAVGPDRSWFLDRLERLCGELGTALVPDADGTVAVTSAPRLLPHLAASRNV